MKKCLNVIRAQKNDFFIIHFQSLILKKKPVYMFTAPKIIKF